VTDSELKHLLIVLAEHDRVRGHEPAYDDEVFTLVVPAEIMHGAFERLDFVDFAVLVVKNV
jgi:hypothetical protein